MAGGWWLVAGEVFDNNSIYDYS